MVVRSLDIEHQPRELQLGAHVIEKALKLDATLAIVVRSDVLDGCLVSLAQVVVVV
jgi:hypothetical protein